MEARKCSRCQEGKYLTEFSRSQVYRDGYDVYCKECRRSYNKGYRRNYHKKICSECGELIGIDTSHCFFCKRREVEERRERKAEAERVKRAFWELFNPEPICSRCGITIGRKSKSLCQKCYYKDQPEEAKHKKAQSMERLWKEGRYDHIREQNSRKLKEWARQHRASKAFVKNFISTWLLSVFPEEKCRFCKQNKKFYELGKRDGLCKSCRLALRQERRELAIDNKKRCSRCLQIRALSGFSSGGKNGWCKNCVNKANRQLRGCKPRKKIMAPHGIKLCLKCNEEKPYSEFYRDSSRKDGYRWQCKACVEAYEQTEARRQGRRKNYSKYKAERNRCPDCGVSISPWARNEQRCPKCAAKKRLPEETPYDYLLEYLPQDDETRGYTDIELELAEALDDLGLRHIHHYSPDGCRFIFDEYLPNNQILIEADGEYWHHSTWAESQGVPEKDAAKNQWASENGYHLVRLRGRDIREFGIKACLLPYLVEQQQLL